MVVRLVALVDALGSIDADGERSAAPLLGRANNGGTGSPMLDYRGWLDRVEVLVYADYPPASGPSDWCRNVAGSQTADGDGYSDPALAEAGCDLDCDDRDAASSPGGTEIPYDGIDNDCDSATLGAPTRGGS